MTGITTRKNSQHRNGVPTGRDADARAPAGSRAGTRIGAGTSDAHLSKPLRRAKRIVPGRPGVDARDDALQRHHVLVGRARGQLLRVRGEDVHVVVLPEIQERLPQARLPGVSEQTHLRRLARAGRLPTRDPVCPRRPGTRRRSVFEATAHKKSVRGTCCVVVCEWLLVSSGRASCRRPHVGEQIFHARPFPTTTRFPSYSIRRAYPTTRTSTTLYRVPSHPLRSSGSTRVSPR